jgi:putative ABC transport system permease protein
MDFRYSLRTLRKNPLFTSIAILCLSVGIATNTTLFSCFNALVLKPLPFPQPDELVFALDRNPANDFTSGVSYPTYLDWREQARSFAGLAAAAGRSLAITEGD